MSNLSGYSVGLITALVTPELLGARLILEREGWQEQFGFPSGGMGAGISTYTKGDIQIYTGAIGEAGQANAGVETLLFLERCERKPTILILCGIAGSLDAFSCKKRDVVVSRAVHWKTPDKVTDGTPCRDFRWKTFHVPSFDIGVRNSLALRVARLFPDEETSTRGFGVSFGDIYTGNYVVSSQTMVEELKAHFPTASCVEMEAGGFLSAVARHSQSTGKRPILPLVVRGISDLAVSKDKVGDDRAAACENATTVALRLLTDLLHPKRPDILQSLLPMQV